MRARKPWVFARFRVFGWYVRFTSIDLSWSTTAHWRRPGEDRL